MAEQRHNFPSSFLRCPYNGQHYVSRERYQYHLVKCMAKHPDMLVICPYNAKHRVAKHELPEHLKACPEAQIVVVGKEFEMSEEPSLKGNTEVPSYENGVTPAQETWD